MGFLFLVGLPRLGNELPNMAKKSVPIEKIIALLKQNPLTIAELTAELTPKQLRTVPNEGGWSAVEVLAHLRSCADVWGNCMATILAEDKPIILHAAS